MATKNPTLKRKNGSDWDTIYPITLGQNVYGSGTQATIDESVALENNLEVYLDGEDIANVYTLEKISDVYPTSYYLKQDDSYADFSDFIDDETTITSNVWVSSAVSNVFAPINEAISRLSDLDRIPYRVEEIAEENGVVNLANLLCNCKEVVNVANSKYKRLPFTPFGINKIRITRPNKLRAESIFGDNDNSNILYVEYKEDIPYFTRDDITSLEIA